MANAARDTASKPLLIALAIAICGLAAAAVPGFSQTCDDGNKCTVNDICGNGHCGGTPVGCPDDGNPCTVESCDPGTGACVSAPLECDDSNPCTTDTCLAGVGCQHANVTDRISCDINPTDCTIKQCLAGACIIFDGVGDGMPCNDFSECTINDKCAGSVCVGTVLADGTTCAGASDMDPCRPECTSGLCFLQANNGESCDDGLSCTANDACSFGECSGTSTCDAGLCAIASCSPIGCAAIDKCAAFQGQCFQAGSCNDSTGECFNTPLNEGGGCDDGNSCTLNDRCSAGTCLGVAQAPSTAPALSPWALAALSGGLSLLALCRLRARAGR